MRRTTLIAGIAVAVMIAAATIADEIIPNPTPAPSSRTIHYDAYQILCDDHRVNC